jgi:hypothetical protein
MPRVIPTLCRCVPVKALAWYRGRKPQGILLVRLLQTRGGSCTGRSHNRWHLGTGDNSPIVERQLSG